MDVCWVPTVGRINVVRTSRGHTDQVGECLHQNVVARSGEGLVQIDDIIVVHTRVVEKVKCHPSFAARHTVFVEREVEVLCAVGMAWVAHVVIIAICASQQESIVSTASILNQLQQRFHTEIKHLGWQARGRISVATHGSCCGRIHGMFYALVQFARCEH